MRNLVSRITKITMKSVLLFCCLFSSTIFSQDKTKDERPNFIFIIADDMRWDAMSFVQKQQGEKARFPWMKTPHLDALAAESMNFQNAMVATAVCSPSRAEYLTGRYGHFNGVASNQIHFPVDNITYATELKKAGYETGYIGKWHMKNQKERPGFDYSASFTGQGHYEDWFFLINGVKTKTEGWIDDVSTDFAIDFINKDHDKPFALSVGFKTPHIPFIPPARAKNRFAGEKVGSVPNFYNTAIYRPEVGQTEFSDREKVLLKRGMLKTAPREEQPNWALDYFRCISAIDENIGRLMATLEQSGLAENTVVIFTSDNGYFMGEHGLGDFRGDKRSAYEESLRVPMLVRYPKKMPKAATSDELVLNIDLAPTLLDFAGVEIPKEIQGLSWAPLLTDKNATFREGFFYEYFFENKFAETPTILAYRTKNKKIVKYPDHQEWIELYDLEKDPYETKNLVKSSKHKKMLKKMEKAYEKEKKAVGYLFPDYAEKPWPDDYEFTRKSMNQPWLNSNKNKKVNKK